MNNPESKTIDKSSNKELESQETSENNDKFVKQLAKEVVLTLEQSSYYSGPIPHPKHMQGYKEVQSDFPERIMALTEKEVMHRHNMESNVLAFKERTSRRNSYLAFSIIVLLIGVGAFLVNGEKEIGGYAAMLSAAAYLIFAFLKKEKPNKKEQESEKELTSHKTD